MEITDMGDLENMLLEAAGRPSALRNQHSHPTMRRQGESLSSDKGSESRGDVSDNDPAYSSIKWPGSQVPLKKRLDPPVKCNNEYSEEYNEYRDGNSDESDVGSDLYKDEYDRKKLAQMTELDRERILSDRAERRVDQLLAGRVRAKQSGKKTQPKKDSPSPPLLLRSSARSSEKAASKAAALKAIQTKRMKMQDLNRNSKDAARGGKHDLPITQASTKAESSSESQSGSCGRGAEGYVRDGEVEDSEKDRSMDKKVAANEKIKEVTYEDIKGITIQRSKLAKWVMEPFFEKLIVGCFVRAAFDRRANKNYYRLWMVKNVDATTPCLEYELESNRTYKYLNVMYGIREERLQMAMVSESAPTEFEFNEWKDAMKEGVIEMPTQRTVMEKWKAMQKLNIATEKQEKKPMSSSRPINIAVEKHRLKRERDKAKSEKRQVDVDRIEARLEELETVSRQLAEKNTMAVRLREMNKKNRAENFKNASEMKPVNTALKAGDSGYDPFSRRWTQSRNYYVSKTGGDLAEALANENSIAKSSEPGGSNQAEAGRKAEAAMAAAAAAATTTTTTTGASKPVCTAGKLVNTRAPVDQRTAPNTLHNFNLPISLAKLQMLGGPQGAERAFMERKQKIEASMGYKVPQDDGKKHLHVLSIGDYKRRRGLS